jgi:Na+/H+ antiporter NhaD/arsenite permease-like protein
MFILVEALTACGFIELLARAGVAIIGNSTFRGTLVSGCRCPAHYNATVRGP